MCAPVTGDDCKDFSGQDLSIHANMLQAMSQCQSHLPAFMAAMLSRSDVLSCIRKYICVSLPGSSSPLLVTSSALSQAWHVCMDGYAMLQASRSTGMCSKKLTGQSCGTTGREPGMMMQTLGMAARCTSSSSPCKPSGQVHLTLMLCCAVLCCAVLCCAVLCCAVLCRHLPCCAMLCGHLPCCVVLCRHLPCCAELCGQLPYCAVLCCVGTCQAALCFAMLRFAVSCCAVLRCARLTMMCCAERCDALNIECHKMMCRV